MVESAPGLRAALAKALRRACVEGPVPCRPLPGRVGLASAPGSVIEYEMVKQARWRCSDQEGRGALEREPDPWGPEVGREGSLGEPGLHLDLGAEGGFRDR